MTIQQLSTADYFIGGYELAPFTGQQFKKLMTRYIQILAALAVVSILVNL